jgi:hypothetical protein
MQIKTTLRFHLTPVRIATSTITNIGEDTGKREPSYIGGGNVSSYNHFRKQYVDFLKN